MHRTLNLALLSALSLTLTLPLAAQRHAPADVPPPADPLPFAVALQLDLDVRLARMVSNNREAFFGFMLAATKPSVLDVPGIGGLLEYEAIVATRWCEDGWWEFDLGNGGWGFDVYLQGAAISPLGAALTNVVVIRDPVPEAK